MMKNIYAPLSGAIAQERVMEIIANNLANVNTVGFKGDRVTFSLLESDPAHNYASPLPPANFKMDVEDMLPLRGNEMAYVGINGVKRDETQGPSQQTQSPLDVMLEGEGLFQVMTPEGMRYTRNGQFKLNPSGVLSTQSGHPVLGEKGDILLRSGEFDINQNGEIWQDDQMVDRILVYKFDQPESLERSGHNYYFYGGAEEGANRIELPSMRQGFLEGSNVNPIQNIANMIVSHRSFEAYQKAVQTYDRVMDRSANSIGQIRA